MPVSSRRLAWAEVMAITVLDACAVLLQSYMRNGSKLGSGKARWNWLYRRPGLQQPGRAAGTQAAAERHAVGRQSPVLSLDAIMACGASLPACMHACAASSLTQVFSPPPELAKLGQRRCGHLLGRTCSGCRHTCCIQLPPHKRT